MFRRLGFNPTNILAFLLQEERRSSTILLGMAVLALVAANWWPGLYFGWFDRPWQVGTITLDLRHWINEVLMALFFLVVSLEVKRELIEGELSRWQQAAFPLFAALGGMLVPALIFAFFNPYPPPGAGWGVPMATDIALAVGLLALLGRRVPRRLRIFLLSLAIIDDIGSIVVIGLFYQRPANSLALLVACLFGIGLFVGRRQRFWPLLFLASGLVIGYCCLLAGVSATMTGVVLAAAMPLQRRRSKLQLAEIIEDRLLPVVSFFIVPLFVLANAGLRFKYVSLAADTNRLVLTGVVLGLFIGKPLGICGASWLVVKLRLTSKPRGLTWPQIAGAGCLGGIGFTVALLVADLAYWERPALRAAAIMGVFIASISSAVTGLVVLRLSLPWRQSSS